MIKKLPKWLGPSLKAAGFSAIMSGIYAVWLERGWLEVTHHKVKIEQLPPEWQGFRLAWLSDLHIEAKTSHTKALEEAVARIIAERPDLVVLGGDYSDRGNWNKKLTNLLAPLTQAGLSVVAVMGNHDYYHGMRGRYSNELGLKALGVTVLIDQSYPFSYKGVTQWIVGIDDMIKGIGDYRQACAGIPAGEKPLLMLTHNPVFMDEVPSDCCGLALAGHIHGGQINPVPARYKERWNWVKWGPSLMRSPYVQGWYEVRGSQLYVGRGLGVTKLPIRFGVRPELPFFELV